MNNQQQIVKALSMLQIAYSTDMSKERMKLYVSMLSNVNPITLEQSVANLINRCKFLPTIAEIREECSALSAFVNAHEELPIAQSEWEKVIKAVGAYGFEHGKEHLQGITLQAANTIWSSFNPRMGNEYNEASCRSQFIRCYEQLAERETHRQRMANSIKDNHLLLKAREKAERERALIGVGQKKIEMTSTGNLVEVVKEPIDPLKAINECTLPNEYKEMLRKVVIGNE